MQAPSHSSWAGPSSTTASQYSSSCPNPTCAEILPDSDAVAAHLSIPNSACSIWTTEYLGSIMFRGNQEGSGTQERHSGDDDLDDGTVTICKFSMMALLTNIAIPR